MRIKTILDEQSIIDEMIADVECEFGYTREKEKSIIKQHHVQFDRIKTTLKVRKVNFSEREKIFSEMMNIERKKRILANNARLVKARELMILFDFLIIFVKR